jgi:hypothetical protein
MSEEINKIDAFGDDADDVIVSSQFKENHPELAERMAVWSDKSRLNELGDQLPPDSKQHPEKQ